MERRGTVFAELYGMMYPHRPTDEGSRHGTSGVYLPCGGLGRLLLLALTLMLLTGGVSVYGGPRCYSSDYLKKMNSDVTRGTQTEEYRIDNSPGQFSSEKPSQLPETDRPYHPSISDPDELTVWQVVGRTLARNTPEIMAVIIQVFSRQWWLRAAAYVLAELIKPAVSTFVDKITTPKRTSRRVNGPLADFGP